MMVTAWNCHMPDFPPWYMTWRLESSLESVVGGFSVEGRICLSPKQVFRKCVSLLFAFGLHSWFFVHILKYVFANNKEIAVQALLPWWPPIVDWDRKAASSQNVTDCVVEEGTCIEVDCGGTLKLENCFWATDGVCCWDWFFDCKR